ncbi:MAG: hypothetical protein ABIR37_01015 [Candidatus Saccharimonadales bacterium]
MNEQKQQLVEKLKSANNILVTVRNNPTVDLLSACIGLTIILNKLDKHATAVFSGDIPSTMEFLKPEETLEKNTDSLRDFIIALDKSKADKLRYKVEDKSVRIFITPYKTSISQDDLEFSQGDFNVDVVVALGAHEQQELDQAITEHGRILHDATVTSINNANNGNLGSINWQDTNASSISELVAVLAKDLAKDKDKPLLDEQIATALLTGIVAETDRFSNSHTTSNTMSISAELMAAGANQQLVATKLQETPAQLPSVDTSAPLPEQPKDDNGTLEIAHEASREDAPSGQPSDGQGPSDTPLLSADDHKTIQPPAELDKPYDFNAALEPKLPNLPEEEEHDLPQITQLHEHDSMLASAPEAVGPEAAEMTGIGYAADQNGNLTANTKPEALDGPIESLTAPGSNSQQLLSHDYEHKDDTPAEPAMPAPEDQPAAPVVSPLGEAELTTQTPASNPTFEPFTPPSTPTPSFAAPASETDEGKTLSEIEQDVHSPHAAPELGEDIDSARDEVLKALQESPATPEAIVALNAQPGLDIQHDTAPTPPDAPAPSTELHLDANGNLQLPSYPPASVNEPAPNPLSPADQPLDMPLPPMSGLQVPPPQVMPPTNTQNQNPNSPPPVPPPMMPPLPQ